MQRLADADLTLDVVGGPPILANVLRLVQQAPQLRIVIDHLPFDTPADPQLAQQATESLRGLAAQPNVFAKVSDVLRRVDDRVPLAVDSYRKQLDLLWRLFGAERVVYGSNWPVCERIALLRGRAAGGHGVRRRKRPRGGGEVLLEEFAGGLSVGAAHVMHEREPGEAE